MDNNSSLKPMIIAFAAIVAVLLAADLAVKQVAVDALAGRPDVVVIPGFWSFHFIGNPDTGFSFLRALGLDALLPRGLQTGLIAAFQLLGVGAAAWFFFSPKNYLGTWVKRLPLALVAAGGLGNAIDRIIRGFVVDYVYWFAKGFSWPIFNLADTYTVVGVIVLAAFLFFTKDGKKTPVAPAARPGELK
jgi:signal peptidase II